MFRLTVAVLLGLVGAAIIHICVIFAMPWAAGNNAWSRLDRLGPVFDVVRIEPRRVVASDGIAAKRDSLRHEFSFVDPAFVTASCRFSLVNGPVRLRSDRAADFWSASVYTRRGDNLYSINDRSAVGGVFDLLIGSAEQLADTKAGSTNPNETTIPVEFGGDEGYVTIRVLVDQESVRPQEDAFVSALSCATDSDPVAAFSRDRSAPAAVRLASAPE